MERTGTMDGCRNIITAHCENVLDFQVVQGSGPANPNIEKKNGFDEMQTSTLTQNLASLPPLA